MMYYDVLVFYSSLAHVLVT